jgi:hypothetical protein
VRPPDEVGWVITAYAIGPYVIIVPMTSWLSQQNLADANLFCSIQRDIYYLLIFM